MQLKEKLVLVFLLFLFLVTGGMFYYQNIHMKDSDMAGKRYVVVAKTDIAEGATFKEGENYSYIALDERFLFEDYIVVDGKTDHKEEIEGKKAKSPILKNEIITKGRIVAEENEEAKFRLFVTPHNKYDIEKGDQINVYAKVKWKDPQTGLMRYETYILMENKVVESLMMKKDGKGVETTTIEALEVHVEELDALRFELAKFLTEDKVEIFVLEHEDVLAKHESKGIPFEKSHYFDSSKLNQAKDAISTLPKAN